MLLLMGLLLRLGPMLLRMGPLLHLGPVITLVPSTPPPGTFHRFISD